MTDLSARLRGILAERSARQLARVAPASLLAMSCGAALGALLIAPGFATGAAGVIIGGIAVNITSAWLERLVMEPLEDDHARAELIEQGLAAGDPGARAVVAATLAAAGPDLAAALPDAGRTELIDGLGRAMQQGGGALAALAPDYLAALRAPEQADWQAIRAAAEQQIRISARVEAGERAEIKASPIEIADVDASVEAAITAGPDARIDGSGISISRVAAGSARPAPPAPPRTIQVGNQAGAGAQLIDAPASYIEHADAVHVAAPVDPATKQRAADLQAYLRRTLHDCNALPLGKIDQTDAAHARPMQLAHVYIALNTTDTIKDERKDERGPLLQSLWPDQQRPLGALEALTRANNGRMMLLGNPGSGKSTFVSHLTYCLAGAALAHTHGAPDAELAKWTTPLPGWQRGALVPIPIVLRDLAALPAVAAASQGSVRLITEFLVARMAELGCPHAAEPLLAALREGRALLLLDGFDEVVGATVLPRVAEAIVDAERNFSGPILVTCRVLDYQEERGRQLPGFAAHTLAELEPDQIDSFIAAWYAELAASGRRSPAQIGDNVREMQGAVQSRDELRALAGSPLLLTLMAQVHAFRGTLPDARALLYYACIELLLLRWRQPRDEPDLIEQLGLARFRSSDLLALMARLGYEAHERAERDAESRGPADLDEATLVAVLAEVFAPYDHGRRFELAGKVLTALTRGNGLLLQRGPQRYTFAHRTFQEFLAGYHLKSQRNALKACLDRAGQLHWHEALLLMVGYQVLGENELEKPIGLAEKLLSGSPLEQALAGDVLALVGRERARGFDSTLIERNGLWPTAIRTLRVLQTRGQAPEAPASMRQRAGLALGRLCYGDLKDLVLPGARPPSPDPRLPLAVASSAHSATWRQALAHYWCAIEPGPFWSGDEREGADELDNPLKRVVAAVGRAVDEARGAREGALRRERIEQPYRIARYTVTNADYARFLAANGSEGYDPDKPWWTAEGRRYLLPGGFRFQGEPEQITHPRFWSVARYNSPLQPVMGVSWYEAAAYCRWLTEMGQQERWLRKSEIIRLPTWHEWERAARHTDTRRHPWGDAPPDPERVNYRATGLDAGTPIGCFPAGVAQCGTHDMIGNVMEWTASPWERWSEWQEDFTGDATIAVSYNDFRGSANVLCCGARDRFDPFYWFGNTSFRLVQSLARS